VDYVRVYQHPN